MNTNYMLEKCISEGSCEDLGNKSVSINLCACVCVKKKYFKEENQKVLEIKKN